VGLNPLGTAATSGVLYKPQMIDEDDCGATGGIMIGRGNRSTRRKPAPAPFCPPQIPHDQTRARTRATAVGSQRLTAWAMARPKSSTFLNKQFISGTSWAHSSWNDHLLVTCSVLHRPCFVLLWWRMRRSLVKIRKIRGSKIKELKGKYVP
jgi:hypothetical protein